MRSVVLDLEHRLLEQRDIPEPPPPRESEVLFLVHEVGVCGTDREMAGFRMRRPPNDVPHLVIGHEALGQVIESGSASGFERGDWVVPMIRRPCSPPCRSCARGRPDLCLTYRYTERGLFGADGYFTELAADDAQFLIRIPEHLIRFAVLMEPLSVVEKAVTRAIAIRQTEENSALVLGLGPIGILAAFVLEARGYRVRLFSLEPDDHPRVELLRRHGIDYVRTLEGSADIILEAAGSAELAFSAVRLLAPAGTFVTLGAQQASGEFSFIKLIVGNQAVIGSVNSNREAFEQALRDLECLPGKALEAMVRRFNFGDFRRTLFEHPGAEPKFVHVIGAG
jgi:threonine dehydrogenase-like Zn-dependent dehydrogenase